MGIFQNTIVRVFQIREHHATILKLGSYASLQQTIGRDKFTSNNIIKLARKKMTMWYLKIITKRVVVLCSSISFRFNQLIRSSSAVCKYNLVKQTEWPGDERNV